MSSTSIEWTKKTWNPVRGCSIVSLGCVNCYAMKQAHRFSGEGRAYHGLTKQTKQGPQWTGKVVCDKAKLLKPLSWRKPCRVFVNSMSDLFHESVPDEFIDRVFAVMGLSLQHTFQILTKRAERMRQYMTSRPESLTVPGEVNITTEYGLGVYHVNWPLPNVWLGVSCENQQTADERIPLLLQTPAAVRWVSAEPLIGPLDLTHVTYHPDHEVDALTGNGQTSSDKVWLGHPFRDNDSAGQLDWIVVGGESGPRSRPFDLAWGRSIVAQCQEAGVPVFVKQIGYGAKGLGGMRVYPDDGFPVHYAVINRKGGDPAEWPESLRVRQFPRVERRG